MPYLTHSAGPTGNAALERRLPILRARLISQREFRIDQLAALYARPAMARTQPIDEVYEALIEAAEAVLADINTALGHIEQGDYGRCRQCLTAEIPIEWLAILPTAAFCPDCLQARTAAG
jgi:RNA polymerase-binding transcription factor DksA